MTFTCSTCGRRFRGTDWDYDEEGNFQCFSCHEAWIATWQDANTSPEYSDELYE